MLLQDANSLYPIPLCRKPVSLTLCQRDPPAPLTIQVSADPGRGERICRVLWHYVGYTEERPERLLALGVIGVLTERDAYQNTLPREEK